MADEKIPMMVQLPPEQEEELVRQLKEGPQRNRTKIQRELEQLKLNIDLAMKDQDIRNQIL